MIGTDRSFSLSQISRSKGNEVATCDVTKMPFRNGMFDGIICISVIHHLATEQRRIIALKELSRILKPGGKVLITAWALENDYRKVRPRKIASTVMSNQLSPFLPVLFSVLFKTCLFSPDTYLCITYLTRLCANLLII